MSDAYGPADQAAEKSTNVRPLVPLPPRVRLLRAAMAVSTAVSPRLAARWAETLFFRPPRPKKASASLPPGAERLDVAGDAGPLAAWSWGAGPVVYLVHGWGGRAEQLGAFVAPLVARGYRVIAVDGPAHGASPGRLSSGPEIGRALATVVRRVAPAEAVIAHSLGAAAVTFAMREGLRVRRLAFIGPPADPLTWVDRFAMQLGLRADVTAEMRRLSETRLRMSWDDLPLVPFRGHADAPALLVVHDREDREVPWTDGAAIARAWPGARLIETQGLGHRRVLRDASVVQAVSAFIAGDADEPCRHGRTGGASSCETCGLEAEMFVPALRRAAGSAVASER